jgi:prolyl-tRNA editing enzyme YbaK/EbsC (Cys-tRNA(Pro) deacylase)
MPIYVERTVLDLPLMYVNGGSRGFLVGIAPSELARVLAPTAVEVGIEG